MVVVVFTCPGYPRGAWLLATGWIPVINNFFLYLFFLFKMFCYFLSLISIFCVMHPISVTVWSYSCLLSIEAADVLETFGKADLEDAGNWQSVCLQIE